MKDHQPVRHLSAPVQWIAVIGIGPRCTYDLKAILGLSDVRCVAIADVQASRRDAGKQLDFFLKYTSSFTWQEFTQDDWQSAAQLWANLRFEGHHAGDADLLIGTYAMRRNATLVTDNEKHFAPLKIKVENWRH